MSLLFQTALLIRIPDLTRNIDASVFLFNNIIQLCTYECIKFCVLLFLFRPRLLS